MDEKKPWYKKIGIIIGSFVTALVTFLFFGTTNRFLRNNRRGTKPIGDEVNRARESNQSARDTVEQLRDNLGDERQNLDECSEIIANIRRRGKKR